MSEPVPPSVLIVHVDEGVCAMVEALARRMGATVRCARSGEQAIDLFVQQPADVVVVGLSLPGRDGVRTVETLRWAPGGEQARVVLLAGRVPEHRLQTAVRRAAPMATLRGTTPSLEQLGEALRRALRPSEPTPPQTRVAPPATRTTVGAPPDATTAELLAPASDGSGLREGRWVARRFEKLQEAARLHGDLEETPFPVVLARLAELRATGELALDAAHDPRATADGGPVRKVVRFRAGVPVQVHSNVLEERLGQVLLRRGRLDEETLRASLERAEALGVPHGEALVEMGLLGPAELAEALTEQLRLRLLDVFSWRSGPFRFAEGPPPPPGGVALEMSLPEILLRGVTGHLDARLALARLRSWLDCRVEPAPEVLASYARLEGSGLDAGLRQRLAERPVLRELVSGSAERALLLYALWCGGAVHFHEASGAEHAPTPERPTVEPSPAQRTVELAVSPRTAPTTSVELAAATRPELPAHDIEAPSPSPESFSLDEELEQRLQAEQLFRQGVHALQAGQAARAVAAFEGAVRRCPEEGEFVAWLAYSRYQAHDERAPRQEALREAERATRLAPDLPVVRLLRARLLEAEGQVAAAREAYEAVLRLDPEHAEAREALQRLA